MYNIVESSELEKSTLRFLYSSWTSSEFPFFKSSELTILNHQNHGKLIAWGNQICFNHLSSLCSYFPCSHLLSHYQVLSSRFPGTDFVSDMSSNSPSVRDGAEQYIPRPLSPGDVERESWRTFWQRIGLKQTQAYLHRANASIICRVTPNRFTSGGTILIYKENHRVRYQSGVWSVNGPFLNMIAYKLNDSQIIVQDYRADAQNPIIFDYMMWKVEDEIYRFHSVTRINPRIARRGTLLAQFGDNTWFIQLYLNIPEECYAFFFFLYVVLTRKKRRWSWST